ncbi:heavy metal translocating P-type ATPase [Geotoga petraea]|uniref:Cadmium-translocating P-type ATPase n=1 Tax=Geotoga petraea TaxID=28234 RepID=A0A4Z0VW00_9BACT|nr:heavy metal translocating P-type ATPase [Geotoga petraea]TGG88171.1 cadmium-translocating P-type ATPase [Geotoga petraea]
MPKQIIKLDGLDCANCATKIEENIKNIDTVKNVNLNFVTKTVTVESENDELDEIKKIVNKYEPDVKVYRKEDKIKSNNKEIKMKIIKFSISAILFILGWIFINREVSTYLFLSSYILSGYNVVFKAIKNIINGNFFDENFLMTIATIGAIGINEIPEAAGVMIFYEIGELFQSIAVDNSRKSIASLMDIRPDHANLIDGHSIKTLSPEELKINDVILIKPGEKVPVDGIILDKETKVNTTALTGESKPKTLRKNEEILSGYINLSHTIKVQVTKPYSESTVSKILDMVENAASKKAKTEKFITKFSKVYTPIVVFSAIALAFIPPLFIGNFSEWFYRGLLFLVISCPCALVVSIPLGYFAGIGTLSKKGVLVKGGNYLEALKNIQKIVFDKTGTLTHGVFEVNKIITKNDFTKEEIIKYAAYSEEHSNHPIALSIKKLYKDKIKTDKIKYNEDISGHGIISEIEDKKIIIGNEKIMKKYNIEYEKSNDFGTIIYIAINNLFAGYFVISDKIRKEAKETINYLNKNQIKTIMLTGDNEISAKHIAKELNIDSYHSELLPNDKVNILEKELGNKTTAFVGDGINDAPVLTRSDVGISMGGLGSDAAIEASDVVIMDDKINKIIDSIKISKKTSKIIWQNIVFILLIKIVFLSLGATGNANMWQAIFADVSL